MPIALNLSLVWFFVLGGLGAFFPFYALYLRENAGLSGTQVGLVMATLPLVGVLTQGLWGQLADRTGSRAQVLALLALGAALGYGAIPHSSGFTGFLVLTAVLALFSTSLIPTCVAVSLALLRESGGHGFGRVRVWGTVGFGVTVGLLPFALDAFQRWRGLPVVDAGPSEAGLELIFFAAAALVFCSGLLALRLPRAGAVGVRAARGDWKRLLRHGPFVRLLLLMFATYLCMQGPMALFPILVRAQGGGLDAISRMWLLMLSLELPLVFDLGAGVARLGPRGVIGVGILAGALRWTASGFSGQLEVVYLAQMLHGVTVWGVVLGAPIYVDAVVPERLRSTGQGLLAMVGISMASIVSNLGSGWLVEHVGPTAPARIGGVGSLVLAALLPLALPPAERPREDGVAAEPARKGR